MGCAAAMYADEIIITSDNPRGEPPEKIIAEIAAEIENYGTPFYILADRDKAIDFAVRGCGKGEIAVIAGKGHETCQIIGSRKIHFDDREAVLASIEKVKDEQHNHWTN
jgi:UDP-N-acetylmuramoyl-L-alanyl-D-glutamate--2,6-diaminopimelate ligase